MAPNDSFILFLSAVLPAIGARVLVACCLDAVAVGVGLCEPVRDALQGLLRCGKVVKPCADGTDGVGQLGDVACVVDDNGGKGAGIGAREGARSSTSCLDAVAVDAAQGVGGGCGFARHCRGPLDNRG